MGRRYRRIAALLVLLVLLAFVIWWRSEWLVARVYLLTLESKGRVAELQVGRVIASLELEPGTRVADVGAGSGLLSRELSRAVGSEGRVYAVDVNATLLAHVERSARRQGIFNVTTVLAVDDDPLLPEPVDLIFICDTLHHITDRAPYLRTLRRYLRPGGRIAIIDPLDHTPHLDEILLPGMRYDFAELERWAEAAGYRQVASYDFLHGLFFVIYRCDSCPGP